MLDLVLSGSDQHMLSGGPGGRGEQGRGGEGRGGEGRGSEEKCFHCTAK